MISKCPKCYNKYIIQNEIETCDEYTQIKQNKKTLIYSQAYINRTDHHISGSLCDLISPACRTIIEYTQNFNKIHHVMMDIQIGNSRNIYILLM